MIGMSFALVTRPVARNRTRALPFESGVSQGRTQRFTISFYLTALLFIVFDIEIVFLYPLATCSSRWAGSGSGSSRSSSASSLWPTCTSGGRGRSIGGGERQEAPEGLWAPARSGSCGRARGRVSSNRSSGTSRKSSCLRPSRRRSPGTGLLIGLRPSASARCAIEMMSIVTRATTARGSCRGLPLDTPASRPDRSGRSPHKMAALLRQIYDQMSSEVVMAMGACASSGCSTTTRCSRASTRSSPSTSMCRDARPGPRRCSRASSGPRRRSTPGFRRMYEIRGVAS